MLVIRHTSIQKLINFQLIKSCQDGLAEDEVDRAAGSKKINLGVYLYFRNALGYWSALSVGDSTRSPTVGLTLLG